MESRTPAQRLPYQSIVDRPKLTLPDNARVVVWPVVNVEDWDISRPMARQVLPAPTAAPVLPDIANWAWHEYGMRVGFWRIKNALDKVGAKATLSINGRVCETYPVVAGAARDAGWEFMGHGYIQMPTHQVDDQPAMIKRTVDTIRTFTGKAPVGWLGPGLTQTFDTVDHLAKAGIRYIGDWAIDDQPMRFETEAGPMVAMPYTVELNDIPMMAVQQHQSDVFLKRVQDTFDRLYEEGADQPRVMCMAVHPFLSGVPHRIRYLEEALNYVNRPGVLFWTGEQLLEWYDDQMRTEGQA
ncbi:polysaccharide deacetylase family protein [Neopusillimonas aestuarii]|uniref:polysaccharide deacetylase family protein n=1 Tax=Neopusillimonas aestuarii TaxID=2716226 RepID=UPI00197D122D|nr:polysaccharide deacetylase family protein [Pusillimonas sp. DMV24BSW_D]